MQDFRTQVAELWQISARLSRLDIFGPDDPLCPRYRRNDLNWQIDVVAPGFVGANYRPGGLVILSINPAGGNDEFTSNPLSNAVYERFWDLRNPKDQLQAFEESNNAFRESIPDWSVSRRHYRRILACVGKDYDDIAFLYVVPFRTRGDKGSRIRKAYARRGYLRHLRTQLEILAPGHVIAIDRHSEEAAQKFREASDAEPDVTYYTRSYSAESERELTLVRLSRMYSQQTT